MNLTYFPLVRLVQNATLQAEKQALQTQLETLKAQSDGLQAQIIALQQQTASLQENNTALQTHNAQLQVSHHNLGMLPYMQYRYCIVIYQRMLNKWITVPPPKKKKIYIYIKLLNCFQHK